MNRNVRFYRRYAWYDVLRARVHRPAVSGIHAAEGEGRVNEATTTARMTAEPLRLLYADEWFVAVHKPEGLLVHRSPPSGSPSRTPSRGNVSTSSALRRRAFSPLCERWAAKRPPVLPAPPASGENKKRSTPAGTGAPLFCVVIDSARNRPTATPPASYSRRPAYSTPASASSWRSAPRGSVALLRAPRRGRRGTPSCPRCSRCAP